MRNKKLDVLRCLAILLVLARHSSVRLRVAAAGWVGVDLFFVLSGFLISGLIFSEYRRRGSISFKRFIVRRWLKLYPAFAIFLLVTLIVEYALGTPSSVRRYIVELFYLQNYANSIWGHTWSLAVEEHFYLILPTFLLLLVRFSKNRVDPFRSVPAAFLVVALACLAARIVTVCLISPAKLSDWESYRKILTPTHERIDSLFFGVTLGYFHHFRPDLIAKVIQPRRNRAILGVVSALLLLPCLIFRPGNPFMLTAGLTMLYLGFGMILMLGLNVRVMVPGRYAGIVGGVRDLLAFVGVYSYSIYLWHGAVMPWGTELTVRWFHIRMHGVPLVGCYLLVSLVFGILMSRLIEYPFLHLRDRLFPALQNVPAPRNSSLPSDIPIPETPQPV